MGVPWSYTKAPLSLWNPPSPTLERLPWPYRLTSPSKTTVWAPGTPPTDCLSLERDWAESLRPAVCRDWGSAVAPASLREKTRMVPPGGRSYPSLARRSSLSRTLCGGAVAIPLATSSTSPERRPISAQTSSPPRRSYSARTSSTSSRGGSCSDSWSATAPESSREETRMVPPGGRPYPSLARRSSLSRTLCGGAGAIPLATSSTSPERRPISARTLSPPRRP
mmetsp:Transcript_6241/g.18251  ORF Transcript_6241/g.18251 Transcript_6241/m.18251 type:complete len:223 (+) Transcript_6241:1885-2553(+)